MKKKRMARMSLMLCFILLLGFYSMTIKAEQGDPFVEPIKVRCTCYIDEGYTASGQYTRPGIMANKREWIGYVACLNAVNEDGSIGEFIGFYEILDTGYGRETGIGESKILKGRTLGTIETGETIDVWCPTMHQAEEWIDTWGDFVYCRIVKGVG